MQLQGWTLKTGEQLSQERKAALDASGKRSGLSPDELRRQFLGGDP